MPRSGRALQRIGWIAASLVAVPALAWIALQRPDIPYDRLEAKYANPVSRFVDLPGGLHVHYRDQGDPAGPAIVMVHGFAASLQAWEPWVRRLGPRYRLVSLDLPAHGLTRAPAARRLSLDGDAQVVDELADRLRLRRFVIVGNSRGGGVAWTYALRHPGRVRALVLVDSVGGPMGQGGRPGSPIVFRLMASPLGRALLRRVDLRPLAAQGLRSAYGDPALVTPALVDRYVDLSRAPGHRDIILQSRPAPPPPPSVFRAIAIPTLVMHGEEDRLIPIASGRALAAAIPDAKLITYPGVGHVPMEQIPDRSAADLEAFLVQQVAPEPAVPASNAKVRSPAGPRPLRSAGRGRPSRAREVRP
jgi:pimeloyl-ACP methyl ester carboxylesterase